MISALNVNLLDQVNKKACLGETIAGVGNVSMWTTATCAMGYEVGPGGVLCATCASTHAMDREGCTACGQLTALHIVYVALAIPFLGVVTVLRGLRRPAEHDAQHTRLCQCTGVRIQPHST